MSVSSNGIVCLKVIGRQFDTETTGNGVKWVFCGSCFCLVNLDSPFSERIVSVLNHGIVFKCIRSQLYPIYNTLQDCKFVHFRVVKIHTKPLLILRL
jgi:hypothetical protein